MDPDSTARCHPTVPRIPGWREQASAVLLALTCALVFLGKGLRSDHSLLPYPPELLQPLRAEYLQTATELGELRRGNLDMGDKYNQSLAWDQITGQRLAAGELPLWTRRIAGGVPFVPQMGQPLHPFSWLLRWLPPAGSYGLFWALHLLILGWTAYLFLRRIQVDHLPALFGMTCLLLGLWTQARVHHNVMLTAVLPLFVMLGAVHRICCQGGGRAVVAILGLATGLSWLSGFAPASLQCSYLAAGLGGLLLLRAAAPRRLSISLRLGAGFALGLLLASAQLTPVLLAAGESAREPATAALLQLKALDSAHLLQLIWPGLLHGSETPFYGPGVSSHSGWLASSLLQNLLIGGGYNYPETACYAGLGCLLLLPMGRGQPFFKSLLLTCSLGLAIALALPGALQLTAIVPGARAGDLKRFLLLAGIGLPILGALGMQGWLRHGRQRWAEHLTLGVALVSLAGWLFHLQDAGSLQTFYAEAIARGQTELNFQLDPSAVQRRLEQLAPGLDAQQRRQLCWVFFAAMVTALACWGLLRRPGRATASALILLTGTELYLHGAGSSVAIPRARVETPPRLLQPLLEASTRAGDFPPRLQRIAPPGELNLLELPAMPNLPAYWGLEDLCAYNPLPKRRMEEFFTALGGPELASGGAGVGPLRGTAALDHPLADLIGIDWLLSSTPLKHPRLVDRTPDGYPGTARLYQRRGSMPRLTFLRQAEVLSDASQRLARLTDRTHDPRRMLILEDPGAPRLPAPDPAAAPARIEVESLSAERIVLRCSTTQPGYLRLADPYDAGWRARCDDQPTPIYRADHYLRAVYLGPGEHRLEFRFDAARVRLPLYASALAGLLLVLLLLPLRRR